MANQNNYHIVFRLTKGKGKDGEMKYGKVHMNRFLRAYVKSYLDELVKHSKPQSEEEFKALQLNGVDYESTMEQGRATLHGYLRELYIEEVRSLPEDCQDHDELATNISKAMFVAGSRHGGKVFDSVLGKKLVFSLAKDETALWKKAKVDPDIALRHIVTETFNRYSEACMDGEELGYAIGIHHDRDHYHAHVILMDFVKSGRLLKMSNRHAVKQPDGSIKRIDHLDMIIGTANVICDEYQRKIIEKSVPLPDRDSLVQQVTALLNIDAFETVANEQKKSNTKYTAEQIIELTNEKLDQVRNSNATEVEKHMASGYQVLHRASRQTQTNKKDQAGRERTEMVSKTIASRVADEKARTKKIKAELALLKKQRRLLLDDTREQRTLIAALKTRTFPKWLASTQSESKTLNDLWYSHLALKAKRQKDKEGVEQVDKDRKEGFETDLIATQEKRVTRQQILDLQLNKVYLEELKLALAVAKHEKQLELEAQMRKLAREETAIKALLDKYEYTQAIIEGVDNGVEPKLLSDYEKIRMNFVELSNLENRVRGTYQEQVIPPQVKENIGLSKQM